MQNRRTKIVINQKFQHQYALVVVVLAVFLTNLFIILQSLIPSEQTLELSFQAALAIGVIEIVLIVGVWYGALKATHKIAGPVYVFTQRLKALGAGDLWVRISLRDGDMFQEEAAAINASLEQLQSKVEAVQSAANALQSVQPDAGANGDDLARLLAALAALRTVRED